MGETRRKRSSARTARTNFASNRLRLEEVICRCNCLRGEPVSGMPATLHRLTSADVLLLRKLNALFGRVFADPDTYGAELPSDAYLERLLAREDVVALIALAGDNVLGGLVAYALEKFERERRELYIYDLAVDERYRRHGIATALIEHLQAIAAERGVWIIYVQADHGDIPAIALYDKFGVREDVFHFDIPIEPRL
jgi:aminoglycoside 3-N-acetyltransferase I